MSGEDPMDYGDVCSSFRVKCWECGKQVVFVGGQRVVPDCGHDLDAVRVDL